MLRATFSCHLFNYRAGTYCRFTRPRTAVPPGGGQGGRRRLRHSVPGRGSHCNRPCRVRPLMNWPRSPCAKTCVRPLPCLCRRALGGMLDATRERAAFMQGKTHGERQIHVNKMTGREDVAASLHHRLVGPGTPHGLGRGRRDPGRGGGPRTPEGDPVAAGLVLSSPCSTPSRPTASPTRSTTFSAWTAPPTQAFH